MKKTSTVESAPASQSPSPHAPAGAASFLGRVGGARLVVATAVKAGRAGEVLEK